MKPFCWRHQYGQAALLLLCLLLPACAQKTIEVKIPVYKRAAPPAELSEWHPGRLPLWIAPIDLEKLSKLVSDVELFNAIVQIIEASSCLTPEGEQQIRDLLLEMKTRVRAWEAWANDPSL